MIGYETFALVDIDETIVSQSGDDGLTVIGIVAVIQTTNYESRESIGLFTESVVFNVVACQKVDNIGFGSSIRR